jgi:hypothetical protein
MSSQDGRAIHAYARLGLDVHPAVSAQGRPRGVALPPEVREGSEADIPFTEAVDRHARGAARGQDVAAMLEMGITLLVAPGAGYALVKDDEVRTLAALSEAGAETVLRAVLARAGERVASVQWMTAGQQWAIRTCVAAGLELRTSDGVMLYDGDVGGFHPYLPSGAFL